MSDLREAIAVTARGYLETPFKHQGRLPGIALDCVGELICTCRELLLVAADFDFTGYPAVPDGRSFLGTCDRYMTRIKTTAARVGDAVVIVWARDPQHIAILGERMYEGRPLLTLIHAVAQGVVEQRLDERLRQKIVAAYRLPGVPA